MKNDTINEMFILSSRHLFGGLQQKSCIKMVDIYFVDFFEVAVLISFIRKQNMNKALDGR